MDQIKAQCSLEIKKKKFTCYRYVIQARLFLAKVRKKTVIRWMIEIKTTQICFLEKLQKSGQIGDHKNWNPTP